MPNGIWFQNIRLLSLTRLGHREVYRSVVGCQPRDTEKAELLIETAMIAGAALANACYAP
jgi:hypothetical protein